jgi:glycosyltransferase involved in cell wall biosynthesis
MMAGEQALPRPVVSVILPTFNRLQYLPAALDSVFAQTYQDWELIVADDGSANETRAYLSSLAGRPKVKVLWLPHSGNPGAVRNIALREAQGEYIAFLDSDDLWMPSKLELQLAALRACASSQWSYTAIILINQTGAEIYREVNARRVYYEGRVFEHLLTSKVGIAMPTVVVSRRLLEQVGGFDERLQQQEDYHLWLRLAMLSEISVLRQPLACVRRHNEHFSSRGISSLEAKDRMLDKMQTLATDSRQRTVLRTARARNAAWLAVANAAAGNRSAAWRTFADSWRFSWRSAVWWLSGAKVLAYIFMPAPLMAIVREYRRAARQASPRG